MKNLIGITVFLMILINVTKSQTLADTIYDYDGNAYPTVIIGDDQWMMENLKTTHFSNGDSIPYITDNSQWSSCWSPAMCFYNNDTIIFAEYGGLYNWYAAVNSRNICPDGWHVPTSSEIYNMCENYLGDGITTTGSDAIAGGKLKETGTIHWQSPNTGASNSSNFYALPGGVRTLSGVFSGKGQQCNLISTTTTASTSIWHLNLSYYDEKADYHSNHKLLGYSVRCIRSSLSIINQPENDTVCETLNSIFLIDVDGFNVSYQWYHNYSPMPLENNDSLYINNVSIANAGEYYCIITDQIDTMSTDTVSLTVLTGCTECYDTIYIEVYDTLLTEIYDTIMVYDSIAVTDTLIIDIVVIGYSPPNNINTIKVYPNPTNDIIYIYTGDYYMMSDYTITITNSISQILFSSFCDQQLFDIDISTLGPSGMYFLNIYDNSSQLIDTRKILLE